MRTQPLELRTPMALCLLLGSLFFFTSSLAMDEPEEAKLQVGVPKIPSPPEKVYSAGDFGVEAPIIFKRVAPKYPFGCIKIRGYIILTAIFRKDGNIDHIKVRRQLGKGRFGFEEAAATALYRWEFLPGIVNGRFVDVRVTLRFDIDLALDM